MQKILEKIKPEVILRLALGLMYLYSGSDLFYHPSNWYGFAPEWFTDFWTSFASMDLFLRMQGIAEFVMGLLFLTWFSGKWGLRIASMLATLEMGGILVFVGIDPITFRDITIFGAALSLLVLSFKNAGMVDPPAK